MFILVKVGLFNERFIKYMNKLELHTEKQICKFTGIYPKILWQM